MSAVNAGRKHFFAVINLVNSTDIEIHLFIHTRGGSRAAKTAKIEGCVIIVNGSAYGILRKKTIALPILRKSIICRYCYNLKILYYRFPCLNVYSNFIFLRSDLIILSQVDTGLPRGFWYRAIALFAGVELSALITLPNHFNCLF